MNRVPKHLLVYLCLAVGLVWGWQSSKYEALFGFLLVISAVALFCLGDSLHSSKKSTHLYVPIKIVTGCILLIFLAQILGLAYRYVSDSHFSAWTIALAIYLTFFNAIIIAYTAGWLKVTLQN